jgi:hypothetical protein
LFIGFECSIKVAQNSVRESQDIAKSDITDIQSVSTCFARSGDVIVFLVIHRSRLAEVGIFLLRWLAQTRRGRSAISRTGTVRGERDKTSQIA